MISEISNDQYRAVFIVNQLGVLFAGLVIFKFKSSENQRLFWIAGFAGGFTTFSTFAVLNVQGDKLANIFISLVSFLISFGIIRFVGKAKA